MNLGIRVYGVGVAGGVDDCESHVTPVEVARCLRFLRSPAGGFSTRYPTPSLIVCDLVFIFFNSKDLLLGGSRHTD
jgi:hypothetical protein